MSSRGQVSIYFYPTDTSAYDIMHPNFYHETFKSINDVLEDERTFGHMRNTKNSPIRI